MLTHSLTLVLPAAGLVYTLAFGVAISGAAQGSQAPPPAGTASSASSPRFDMEVRSDFFTGFSGNAQRLARGMARTEEVLAVEPDHAEALVWHGSGLMFTSGRAF